VAATVSTIVAGRIAWIALNENASRLEQNAAASPFPCVKKDSPLALTKLQRVDSRGVGGGLSIIYYYIIYRAAEHETEFRTKRGKFYLKVDGRR